MCLLLLLLALWLGSIMLKVNMGFNFSLHRTALFPSGARALHFTVTKTLALCSSKLVFKGNLDRELCSANVESPGQRGAMAELRVGPFLTDERLSPWSRQQQKWV